MKNTIITLGLLIFLVANNSFAQVSHGKYIIANKIHLDGDGGWDYLTMDDLTSRLYISHGSIVQVLDVATRKLLGTITGTKGVHGIALANTLNKGFTSNSSDSSVTIFDLKTLQFLKNVKITGEDPDAILFDPFSQRVFVFNRRSSNSTVIDANSNKVIKTIALSGRPEFSTCDLKGKVYVNIEDKNEICVINSQTLEVEHKWQITPGIRPSGMAIDIKNHRLFSVCDNEMMVVINSENGKVVSSVPIGKWPDGVAFDPILERIYTSNGEGTMTIIQEEKPNSFKVLENFPTQSRARTIAINSKTQRIYLPVAEYGETPAPTSENPNPRQPIRPNTFTILEIVMK